MIGRLMGKGRKTPVEVRLDALEAAIDVKLQALLATATQAIAEVVREELARGRQRGGAVPPPAPLGRPQTRSLLDPEATLERATALRQALGLRSATGNMVNSERGE